MTGTERNVVFNIDLSSDRFSSPAIDFTLASLSVEKDSECY